MAVTIINKNDFEGWDIRGLSTDIKPTAGIPNGSTFFEMDTSKAYMFDAQNTQWRQL